MKHLIAMTLSIYLIVAFAGCCCQPPPPENTVFQVVKYPFKLDYRTKDMPKNGFIEKVLSDKDIPQSYTIEDDIHTIEFLVTYEDNVSESLIFTLYFSKSEHPNNFDTHLEKRNIRLISQQDRNEKAKVLWESKTSFYDHDMDQSNYLYPLDHYERLYDGSTKHIHYTYTYGYEGFSTKVEYNLKKEKVTIADIDGVGAQWAKDELKRWAKEGYN